VGKTQGQDQFGPWLRAELDQRGYTERGAQSRFARQAGVHLSIISRILNEGRAPDIDVLRRIGKALGYTLGEMMIHAGVATPDELPVRINDDAPPTPPAGPPRFDDPALQHLWETPTLSEVEREALVSMFEAMRRVADNPRSHQERTTVIRKFGT